MAKKQTMGAEHKAMAEKLGIDVSQLDVETLVKFVRMLLAMIGVGGARMTATAKAGCETHCEGCLEAARLSLESAETSLDCAQGMCETPGVAGPG